MPGLCVWLQKRERWIMVVAIHACVAFLSSVFVSVELVEFGFNNNVRNAQAKSNYYVWYIILILGLILEEDFISEVLRSTATTAVYTYILHNMYIRSIRHVLCMYVRTLFLVAVYTTVFDFLRSSSVQNRAAAVNCQMARCFTPATTYNNTMNVCTRWCHTSAQLNPKVHT